MGKKSDVKNESNKLLELADKAYDEEDYNSYIQFLREAVKKGNVEAMYELGYEKSIRTVP